MQYSDASVYIGKSKQVLTKVNYLGGFFILFIIWLLISLTLENPTFLPSPIIVLLRGKELLLNGTLHPHIITSIMRVFFGFLISAIVAISLGLLMAFNKYINLFVDPFIELIRPIPPYAFISLSLLWFGSGFWGPIFIICIATLFPVLLNTYSGVKQIDNKLVEAAKSLGASNQFVLFRVIIPAAIPSIITGLRLGFGAAWLSLIAAEMVGTSIGLGFLISDAREFVETDIVIMGMIIIGIIGYFINKLFLYLQSCTHTSHNT